MSRKSLSRSAKSSPSSSPPKITQKSTKSPPNSKKRGRKTYPSLNEDDLLNGQLRVDDDEVLEEMTRRKFWELVDPRVGAAWLMDFENSPITTKNINDRQKVLDLLVQHAIDDNFPFKNFVEEAETETLNKSTITKLTNNYTKVMSKAPDFPIQLGAITPPSRAHSLPTNSPHNQQPFTPSHSSNIRPTNNPYDDEIDRSLLQPPNRILFPNTNVTCKCCEAAKRPLNGHVTPDGQWKCSSCLLRGDLEPGDPTNFMLAMLRGNAPGNNNIQINTNNSTNLAQVGAPPKPPIIKSNDPYDRHFDEILANPPRSGKPIHPSFNDTSPMSSDDAISDLSSTIKGVDYAHPSDSLKKLIRSGIPFNLGFTIPRTYNQVNQIKLQDGASSQVELFSSDSGLIAKSKKVIPPEISSPSQLLLCLVSTILPCVMDNPKMVHNWCQLIASGMHAQVGRSWSCCMEYINAQLQQAYNSGAPIHPPLSIVVNNLNFNTFSNTSSSSSSSTNQPRSISTFNNNNNSSTENKLDNTTCWNYNLGDPCKYTPCTFSHKCWNLLCTSRDTHLGAKCRGPKVTMPTGIRKAVDKFSADNVSYKSSKGSRTVTKRDGSLASSPTKSTSNSSITTKGE